jgi:hypothetical protein
MPKQKGHIEAPLHSAETHEIIPHLVVHFLKKAHLVQFGHLPKRAIIYYPF